MIAGCRTFSDFFDNSWMERTTYTAPAINVIENEKEYDVELAAPGLTKEDFKVHIDADNNLHIEMEKKSENKEGKKHGKYLRREFSYEKFQQTLLLPEDAEADSPYPEEGERPAARYSQADCRPVTVKTSPIDKGRRPQRETSFFLNLVEERFI